MEGKSTQQITRETLVIFLHIPKTGGTTLWSILQRQYGAKRVVRVMQGGIIPNDAELRRLASTTGRKYRLLGGHVPYGVHTATQRPYSYFTFLRDPVQWLISSYYKVIRKTTHPLHEQFMKGNIDINAGILFLEDNMQTRLLAGISDKEACTREHLDIAKQNLRENIDVIGLMERYDESLILLKRFYGWGMPYYYRKNVGANARPKERHTPETLEIAQAHNALDMELYTYGQTLFEAQVKAQDKRFTGEVARFQQWSPLISQVLQIRDNWVSKRVE